MKFRSFLLFFMVILGEIFIVQKDDITKYSEIYRMHLFQPRRQKWLFGRLIGLPIECFGFFMHIWKILAGEQKGWLKLKWFFIWAEIFLRFALFSNRTIIRFLDIAQIFNFLQKYLNSTEVIINLSK